eukprot:3941690-Rhodomonas_salina.6
MSGTDLPYAAPALHTHHPVSTCCRQYYARVCCYSGPTQVRHGQLDLHELLITCVWRNEEEMDAFEQVCSVLSWPESGLIAQIWAK